VKSFCTLELWGKTPIDMGLSPDNLDPAWDQAMYVLKNALENERKLTRP